jgi:hypothetical protein
MSVRLAIGWLLASLVAPPVLAAELGPVEVFSVVEVLLSGPEVSPSAAPARDIRLIATFRHVDGTEHRVHGFHDGGNQFKVRFCPTRPGRWDITAVECNEPALKNQRLGDHVTARESRARGFWIVDDESPGRRWYRRSDGSHQFIFGNTHYSFLSRMRDDGPARTSIADDVAANAKLFKKLRFTFSGDRYPHPVDKPFLDDEGRPTDSGDHSHRPNPKWFRERVDVAVQSALTHDVIADLILCGPDVVESRATLRAAANGGNPEPFLRYVAARYGSYPNVWICLCNEYDIKTPKWTEGEVVVWGKTIREFLPYPTPLSVHASQHPDHGPKKDAEPAWATKFDSLPEWNDHQILQRKLRTIAAAADITQLTWQPASGKPRLKPTINDELSYTGDGDKHSDADTLASHLGAFLGGGYASTGEKRGNKLGHYFWGDFDPAEHPAAVGLGWLRERIDQHVTFWKMAPDASVFPGLNPAFRAMAWPQYEYALGSDRAAEVIAELPSGLWTVRSFDVIAREESTITQSAQGTFRFQTPDSRAALIHFKRTDIGRRPEPSKR